MKISKKLSLVMASVATLSIIGATTAFANNCSDTPWSLSAGSRATLTSSRAKEDDSSAYGRVITGGYSTAFKLVDSNGNDFIDPSTGNPHSITRMVHGNNSAYVDNYANELGYRTVRMRVERSATNLGSTGLWSPDSI